jgi:hypothetical protein
MSEQTREAPTVFDHIAVLLDQMAGVAWQKLGLQPDMVTGQIEPNLEQARVAIDVVSFLAGRLEPQLDEDDKRQVQSLVRDLKINFVQKGGA